MPASQPAGPGHPVHQPRLGSICPSASQPAGLSDKKVVRQLGQQGQPDPAGHCQPKSASQRHSAGPVTQRLSMVWTMGSSMMRELAAGPRCMANLRHWCLSACYWVALKSFGSQLMSACCLQLCGTCVSQGQSQWSRHGFGWHELLARRLVRSRPHFIQN